MTYRAPACTASSVSQPFCRARGRDQQTDRQTDVRHLWPTNSLHLSLVLAMRAKNQLDPFIGFSHSTVHQRHTHTHIQTMTQPIV